MGSCVGSPPAGAAPAGGIAAMAGSIGGAAAPAIGSAGGIPCGGIAAMAGSMAGA